MENSKQAVIDIGSNSVRLLVAECAGGNVAPIYKAISTTRLSEGLAVSGILNETAMKRTAAAVYDFNIKAIEMGVQNVWCFATAAVRNAQNAEAFTALVKEKVLLDVDVLSRNMEAKIGFIGVGGTGTRGIIDIGGGSTEIAIGGGRLVHRCSMDLGAVAALDMYPLGDVSDSLTLEAMRQWAQSIMSKEAASIMLQSSDVEFTGIGGTITTLAAMEYKMAKYDPMRIQGKRLTLRTVQKWYGALIKMPLKARRAIVGIEPQRADIIIGGVVIMLTFMELFSLKEIRVSDSGNLEGYLKTKLNIKPDKTKKQPEEQK
jgi:exopolyphosphatase/guanosine-5'-triphosphate,3'-diphosphate pyrophosphatase